MRSLKMLTPYLAEGLKSYYKTLPKSGKMRLGRHTTQNTSDPHKEEAEFILLQSVTESPPMPIFSSLEDVILKKVEKRWNLSIKGLDGILRRAKETNTPLPTLLDKEVMNLKELG